MPNKRSTKPLERRYGGRSREAAERRLAELIEKFAEADQSGDDGLRRLGELIDLPEEFGRLDGIQLATRRGQELLAQETRAERQGVAHYFLANAWEVHRQLTKDTSALRDWDQPELAHVIIHLRTAAGIWERLNPGLSDRSDEANTVPIARSPARDIALDETRIVQIYTNLANHMNHLGRLVDAVRYWKTALARDPLFSMALGNLGYGLLQLTSVMHDPIERGAYAREAHVLLTLALSEPQVHELHEDPRDFFVGRLKDLRESTGPGSGTSRPCTHF